MEIVTRSQLTVCDLGPQTERMIPPLSNIAKCCSVRCLYVTKNGQNGLIKLQASRRDQFIAGESGEVSNG